MRISIVLLSLAALASVVVAAPTETEHRVVRVYYDDLRATAAALQRFDLWEYNNVEERYLLVLIDPGEYPALEALGLRLELDVERTAEINAPRMIDPTQVEGIPGFACFRTVEETYGTAEQIVAEHQTLASWIDVGDSWEKENGLGGWDMRVLRLTNSAIPGPKPPMFITGSIHAREYAPAELVTRFAEWLVDGYGTDADATWILDYHEIHLMLMANPDARKKAETGLSWRKNVNEDYCSPTSNDRGVDLNRNFSFEWGCCNGSSGNECWPTYRGPFPFSDPESAAVRDYILTVFPDQRAEPLDAPAPDDATGIYIDIHSAVALVIWPWGFAGTAPNDAALTTFGRKLAWFNGYEPKQAVLLYPTDGTTIDYSYGELGVASLAYELDGTWFQDCGGFEAQTFPDNLASLIYAARVVRTPYLTPAGPEPLQVSATPAVVEVGTPFELTATLDDTRFNNQNGNEPVQAIVAAEYYLDLPPWEAGSPAPTGMFATDGSFDATVEQVTATVSTAGLVEGRHIVFLRGRDAGGNWGAFGAAFFDVEGDPDDVDGDGVINGLDCDPNDGSVWALPSSVRELTVSKQPFGNLSWLAPLDPGAQIVGYHVLRSTAGDDFDGATCSINGGATAATDGHLPPAGEVNHYLIRVLNRCGGNLGSDSAGIPRQGADCSP